MSRGDRFRRLARRTGGAAPRAGDLFEHFGVQTDPRSAQTVDELAVRTAAPCSRCAWFVAFDEALCPNCAEPRRPRHVDP